MVKRKKEQKQQIPTKKQISCKRLNSIIGIQNKFILTENSLLEYVIYSNFPSQNDLFCYIVSMPPRQTIPNQASQLNDIDTEPTEPGNAEASVVDSDPILIGQLRTLPVSTSDSSEDTYDSSSEDINSGENEVTRYENRRQSSEEAEQPLPLVDTTDEVAYRSSHCPLQTDPNVQRDDDKSTLQISSTTNPFHDTNEPQRMENQGITTGVPLCPMYESLEERLRSFSNWPKGLTQTPHDLASAGFFYMGYSDRTRCFFCGGVLFHWEAEDDPLTEHARFFHNCAFVRHVQEQGFINLAQKRAAKLNGQENQEGKKISHTSDPSSDKVKEEKVMRSPAVTTIKDMGYSEDKIKAAINKVKRRPTGEHKVSAQEILEVIFELNESGSSTSVNHLETISEDYMLNTTQSEPLIENTTYYMIYPTPTEEGTIFSLNEADLTSEASSAELTSLKQENKRLKDQIMCKICMEKNVSIAFLPCRHLACCEDCAPALRNCPICSVFVRGTVKTRTF